MKNKNTITVSVILGIMLILALIPSAVSQEMPSGPILMYPENGTHTTDHILTFGWYGEEWAQKYFLQVDNNSDFSSPEIETYVVESQFTMKFPLSDATYYWRVKAIDDSESKWLWPDRAELTIFTPTELLRASADLGIAAQQQHKDTRMLCLGGCPLSGDHAWNVDHVTRGCEHCNWYCVRASISMVNSYYGGSLSQDRISYYILEERPGAGDGLPEGDLGHGRGIYPAETTAGLSWALNGAAINNPFGKPTFTQIKAWIDNGQPVLRRSVAGTWHATVIDGYDDAGQLVHVIDPWTGTEGSLSYDTLPVYEVWIGPSGATSRSDEASLSQDSDGDDVIDFDEINRFRTDPNKVDSDGDCVPDKAEVRCYTFLSDDSFDLADDRKPDPDGDGLRAELDRDSDNGGVIDGTEDLNRNGKVEIGETDPLDAADDSEIDTWAEINEELDALIVNVTTADMPNIIKQRLVSKLEYAKALKDNAKEEYEACNVAAATKKLGVAKNQVGSFASMVRITRRISAADKASFLADATAIIGKIDELIEYIETEHA